jgi:hypothetical protein
MISFNICLRNTGAGGYFLQIWKSHNIGIHEQEEQKDGEVAKQIFCKNVGTSQ